VNLAQLIDAEWVQAGCKRRFALQRPAPAPDADEPQRRVPRAGPEPVVAVTRKPGTVAATVLQVLAQASAPRSLRQVVESAPRFPRSTVSTWLVHLTATGEVKRTNADKPYLYAITAFGRSRLA